MTSPTRRDGLITHTRGDGGLEPPVGPDLDGHLRRHRDALIATVNADGSPQLTPVWYLWDGKALSASVPGWTVKVANLRREPRVAICVDDEVAGCYATLTGSAELVEGPPDDREGVRAATWPLLLKYLPEDEAAARWTRIDAAGDRVVIRLVPSRILWRAATR
jgi:PPOX class probable F420-dependent enzyme